MSIFLHLKFKKLLTIPHRIFWGGALKISLNALK